MPRFLNLFPESPRPSTIVRHATKYSGSITVNSPVFLRQTIEIETTVGSSITDITQRVKDFLCVQHPSAAAADEVLINGIASVTSQHTTTAIIVNEYETRLVEDLRLWLNRQAPGADMYLHNDLEVRELPEGWTGTAEEWIAQEPRNAHSHLQSMLLGNSESFSVESSKPLLGRWQSVMLVDLDGPRTRKVELSFVGVISSD